MPRINLTNEQFDASRQAIQSRYIKIELLNYQFQTVDSLEGKCIGGNININADSDLRRTGSITLIVNDTTFEIDPGGKIFLDKYLKIWVGTYSLRLGDISWTNCGIYLIDAPSYHYDFSNNALTLSLLDLMSKLTGVRNGYLKGFKTVFKAGEKIRDSIIAMLKFAGFNKYVIQEPPAPGLIPFDLEFSQGSTVYTVLKGLCDLYIDYEMFFDINGTFIYQKRPTGKNDPIIIDDSLWNDITLSEDISVDFQSVKNSIEVYGRSHEPARFSTETKVEGNLIHLVSADVYHYFDNLIYGFTLTDNPGYNNMMLEINELGPLPILDDNGVTPSKIPAEQGEVYYCVQFKEHKNAQGEPDGGHFYWLGHLQSYGLAEDTNSDSPFYINGPVGKISMPLFGGDYDNIFTDDLAQQRAEYELYLRANLKDTINLTCAPVYWMDVNILVEYITKRNNNKGLYLVKTVDMGLAPMDTMTVSLMKFYPTD